MSGLRQTSIMLPDERLEWLRGYAHRHKTSMSRVIDGALEYQQMLDQIDRDTYGPAETAERD